MRRSAVVLLALGAAATAAEAVTINASRSSSGSGYSGSRNYGSSYRSESTTHVMRGTYGPSLKPKEPIEIAPNGCGASAFEVVNPGGGEAACTGRGRR